MKWGLQALLLPMYTCGSPEITRNRTFLELIYLFCKDCDSDSLQLHCPESVIGLDEVVGVLTIQEMVEKMQEDLEKIQEELGKKDQEIQKKIRHYKKRSGITKKRSGITKKRSGITTGITRNTKSTRTTQQID